MHWCISWNFGPVFVQYIAFICSLTGFVWRLWCMRSFNATAGTGIGVEGAKAIGEGLKHNSSLQTLGLRGECRKDESMWRWMSEVMEHWVFLMCAMNHCNRSNLFTTMMTWRPFSSSTNIWVSKVGWNCKPCAEVLRYARPACAGQSVHSTHFIGWVPFRRRSRWRIVPVPCWRRSYPRSVRGAHGEWAPSCKRAHQAALPNVGR